MLNIIYTINPESKQLLETITRQYSDIAGIPLNPAVRRKLEWDAMIERLMLLKTLMDDPIEKPDILRALVKPDAQSAKTVIPILNYRAVLLSLFETWFALNKPITMSSMETLADLLVHRTGEKPAYTRFSRSDISQFISYISSQKEHPAVTTAISIGYLNSSDRASYPVAFFSLIVSYVFLFQRGFGSLLTPIEFLLTDNKKELGFILEEVQKTGNYSHCIQYILKSLNTKLHQSQELILYKRGQSIPKTFQLSDRERQILLLADEPGAIITNKKVQKSCHVSQITASRDLSRLSSLGLILPHGRGRSIYYTKR